MRYIPTRQEMFLELPKGTVGAEVGVQSGLFSCEIDLICSPKELHLVDCWEHQSGCGYQDDPANLQQSVQDQLYEYVKGLAERHPSFRLHRMYSKEAGNLLTELDWVYLDANHSYKECLVDLIRWSQNIKPGGCIMGHDFVDNGPARKMGFGVIKAVEDFCYAGEWLIDALTCDEWSSYKLVRS